MTRFKRILHPSDFSRASAGALAKAVQLAKDNRAELVVLHVLTLPLPMMAGPRTVLLTTRAPASTTTLPVISESSTEPSVRGTSVSRMMRLASSMSSSLPVSFHQPSTMCGRTSRPRSMRS